MWATTSDGTGESQKQPPAGRRRRWRRLLIIAAIAMPLLVVGLEVFCRVVLGLGQPPLSQAHPTIEYMFKPDQHVRRFGNEIIYNSFGIRGGDFPKAKTDPAELRVLVLGDSVINGGALTDQQALATEQLGATLRERLGRPVVVANISAGSWGPANQEAYLDAFGLFDADVVLWVLSSHDHADYPTFEPVIDVHPSYPSRPPVCALEEAVKRYAVGRIRGWWQGAPTHVPASADKAAADAQATMASIDRTIDKLRSAGVPLLVLLHASAAEVADDPEPGRAMLTARFAARDVPTVDLTERYRRAADEGHVVHRDAIHLSAEGQAVLAEAMLDALSGGDPGGRGWSGG